MQCLATKELHQLRPTVGGDIKVAYHRLQSLLGEQAIFFAEPVPMLGGDRIAWHTTCSGQFKPLSELSGKDRQQAIKSLTDNLNTIVMQVKHLNDAGITTFFEKCLQVPFEKNIMIDLHSRTGNPVVVVYQWGFVHDIFPVPASALQNLKKEDPPFAETAKVLPAVRASISEVLRKTTSTPSLIQKSTIDQNPPVAENRSDKPVADVIKQYQFDVGKHTFHLELPLFRSEFAYFNAEQKYYVYHNQKPPDWERAYYDMFLENDRDRPTLLSLLAQLKTAWDNTDLAAQGYFFIEVVIAFVQGGLQYDYAKLQDNNRTKRYPYETLFLGSGVCEDKTLLLAKIFYLLNYSYALLAFDKANHIAVALAVPRAHARYNAFQQHFCFLESTNYAPIGHIPEQMAGGIKLAETPRIIIPRDAGQLTFEQMPQYLARLSREKSTYGDAYLHTAAQGKKILESMTQVKNKMEVNKQNIEYYNQLVSEHNQLAAQFNHLNNV